MFSASWFAISVWVEIGFGLVLPAVLLMMPEVRESRRGLATACSFIIAGVLLNRLNVSVIGLRVRHWETYVPSFGEVGITLGITAAALFAFGYFARILPIHEELPAPEAKPHSETRSAGAWHGAEGVS
jgi:Ni/Fe-hydrogenase subunit HybB-like protein